MVDLARLLVGFEIAGGVSDELAMRDCPVFRAGISPRFRAFTRQHVECRNQSTGRTSAESRTPPPPAAITMSRIIEKPDFEASTWL